MKKIHFNLSDKIDLNASQYQRAMALLAVFQAARLIMPDRLLQRDMPDAPYQVLYRSLFVTEFAHVQDLYGGDLSNLRYGGEAFYISSAFQQHDKHSLIAFIGAAETLEDFKQIKLHALLILRLQKRMFARRQTVQRLWAIMDNLRTEHAGRALDNTAVQQALAQPLRELFAQQQGFISQRLLTNQAALQRQPELANRAYCALFAGVRAAYVWRQLGGGVIKDIFWRSAANPLRLYAEMHR